jgi:dihydroneopterin aldolase
MHSLTTKPHMIEIQGLEVFSFIGVPDEERAVEQRLLLDVTMEAKEDFRELEDSIARTVDYHAVAIGLTSLAAARPRKLIETLAQEAAAWIVENHSVCSATVRVRKFILPQTEWVAVTACVVGGAKA